MNQLLTKADTPTDQSPAVNECAVDRRTVRDEAKPHTNRSPGSLNCQFGTSVVSEISKVQGECSSQSTPTTSNATIENQSMLPVRNLQFRAGDFVRRSIDLMWSLPLAIMLAPAWMLVATSFVLGRQPIRSSHYYGRNGGRFIRMHVDSSRLIAGSFLRRAQVDELLGLLANVLKGDLTLVGPRPLSVQELRPSESVFRERCAVTPGLICLWWIRRRTNMAYQSEWATDQEYLRHRGLRHDLGIVMRAFVAKFYGGSQACGTKGNVMGIPFDNLSMEQAIEKIYEASQRPGLTRIAFINADCVNLASKNAAYREVLNTADLVFADGIGIKIAGQLVGCPVKENVNGTDLFPRLCSAIEGTGVRLYLLGGRPGVAERVRDWIDSHAPGVTVCGLRHGYFSASDQSELIRDIDHSGADIVLVAFGAPKQDLWIRDVLSSSQARVAVGVGGLFDFYSGRVPRAPLWIREMGLEWIYRLYQEPRRLWRRYVIGNATFLFRVIAHRFRYRLDRSLLSTPPQLEVE